MIISVETKESSYEVTIPDGLTANVDDPMRAIVSPVLDSARDYIFKKECLTELPKFTIETVYPKIAVPESNQVPEE